MPSSDSILVVDVGTSGVRAAVVRPDGAVTDVHREPLEVVSPEPGTVEMDAMAMARAVTTAARAAAESAGRVGAIGITNQRATTVVWERRTGQPVAPAIGWQ